MNDKPFMVPLGTLLSAFADFNRSVEQATEYMTEFLVSRRKLAIIRRLARHHARDRYMRVRARRRYFA